MPKIRILSDQTINQIAAGEVIENSASVVKELVENALDSGATSIKIETKGAGRSLIRVVDDGCGMDQDDLVLALERHATSKINVVEDLENIHSLGFRGEALPSIASVSKMLLQSSLGDRGACIEVAGGKVGQILPYVRTRGTTVEVRSLFYNVPVRRKFQKSVASDVAEIHKCLTKTALAHNGLHLCWVHEGKVQFELTKEMNLLDRIGVVLGNELADNLIEVKELGYISKPTYHRPNKTGQYLAINQRALNSPFISQKVLESYSTRLPIKRFPMFVFQLSFAPDWIDVNVHPQKREVRLREHAQITSHIVDSVEKALGGGRSSMKTIFFEENKNKEFIASVVEEQVAYQISEFEQPKLLTTPKEVIAVLGNTIVVRESYGMRLYDVKAISYCIHYEMIKENKIEQQALLFPQIIEVTAAEVLFLMEHLEQLNQLGIAIRHFGEKTFLIDAIPVYLQFEEIPSLIAALFEEEPRHFAKVIAKKGRGCITSVAQACALLGKLERCTYSEKTPDGKSISIVITEGEIKKRFESH